MRGVKQPPWVTPVPNGVEEEDSRHVPNVGVQRPLLQVDIGEPVTVPIYMKKC